MDGKIKFGAHGVAGGTFRLAVGLTLLCVGALLFSACSRQEKPAKQEPKSQSFEVAPTPAVEVAGPLNPTGQIKVVRMGPTGVVQALPPRVSASTPETRKAVRERQQAFARKHRAAELDRLQVAHDAELQELQKKEGELRAADPAVKTAYAGMMEARQAYEAACEKDIPGYAVLVKESAELRAGLTEIVDRKNRGETVDVAQLAGINRRFNDALLTISQMRGQANAAVPTVAQALQDVVRAQGAYEQCLLDNKEYSLAKITPDRTAAEIARLTSMQGE